MSAENRNQQRFRVDQRQFELPGRSSDQPPIFLRRALPPLEKTAKVVEENASTPDTLRRAAFQVDSSHFSLYFVSGNVTQVGNSSHFHEGDELTA